MRNITILTLGLALGAGGCAAGPDYRAPGQATLGVPEQYYQAPGNAITDAELANWWTQLGDPTLNTLIEKAIGANLDIAQAKARLRQARESLVQSRSQLFPTVEGSAGAGRDFDSDAKDSSRFTLGADAAWEVDLFGGIGRSVEAARADAQASYYDLASVRTAIIAELATNYVQARLAQEQIGIARNTLDIQTENLNIAGWRVQAGLVSSLDEESARAQRAQTAASIAALESSYRAALNRIAVLIGEAPGAATKPLEEGGPIPIAPASLATGIPGDTLRQRPDVRSAERTLAAETARIGVAKAQLFPSLQITGNVGTSALSVGKLTDVITGGLFASLAQIIFDGGQRASEVRAQRAAAQGAFDAYKKSVLTALEDVENALSAVQSARGRTEQFAIALDASSNSALLARSQYQAGLTDFQTLLTAEQSLLSARDGLASAQADQALALIQLYSALGGGWQTMDGTTQ
ncbi:efflux transporter outer membrane subunit [Rhizorhapis sp.]|uniref:efflux transporter outer membrane subunit n=1 Tax=Rhizorhapis sp. TaxID=1968842 RepID=UPI002B45D73B|nr:efflux transporter outer membrane subunit [Rhizorhapis sp.]HKR17770.1 efflux transporter outer membrane subunit [Rhizorhapis sp.]